MENITSRKWSIKLGLAYIYHIPALHSVWFLKLWTYSKSSLHILAKWIHKGVIEGKSLWNKKPSFALKNIVSAGVNFIPFNFKSRNVRLWFCVSHPAYYHLPRKNINLISSTINTRWEI